MRKTRRSCAWSFLQKSCSAGCHNKACQVGNQGCRQGVFCFFDTGSTEVDPDGIKGGFRGAKHDGNGFSNVGIYSVDRHQICPDRQSRTTADGTDQHQKGGFRRNTYKAKNRREPGADMIYDAGRTKHPHRCQQKHQRRHKAYKKL